MRLTVLGCGDALGSGGRFQTCFHVAGAGSTFLVDCGATALIAMRRFGVDPNGVETVFLTHLHGDHFGGLPWLILDGQFVSRRQRPLTVVGPPGTDARLTAAMDALYPDLSGTRRAFALDVREIEAGAPVSVGGVSVMAFAVSHPSGAPPYGLRLAHGGRVLAYTGDTEWVDALVPLGRDADLLIAECSTLDRPLPWHLSWAVLRARLPEIAPRRLLLTHMGPEMIAHPPEGYIAAQDGMVLDV